MELVVFTGAQGCGKSAFYFERYRNTHVRINLDMLKTRHRERLLVEACLAAKAKLLVDNTNPEPGDRARYILPAKAARFRVVGCYFPTPLPICLERNGQRTGRARVPDSAVRSTWKRLRPPSWEEGFDELFAVRGDCGIFQVEAIAR